MPKAKPETNGDDRSAPPRLMSMTGLAKRFRLDAHYLSGLIDGMGFQTFHGSRGSKCIAETDAPRVAMRLRELGRLAPVGARS